jgi:predicted YcjX-like family ATPase
MVNLSWLPPIVTETSGRVLDALNLSDLTQGSTVWLAVTGLSRSGKTVLITSLIHNLLSALHNPHRMPLLKVVGEGRLIAARLEAARAPLRNRRSVAADHSAKLSPSSGRSRSHSPG